MTLFEAINDLETQGYSAARGLRIIAEKHEATELNEIATNYYAEESGAVAAVVEMMISVGKIIPAKTNRWWPSALDKLRTLEFHGYEIKGNPPYLVTWNTRTGNIVTCEIAAPTQEAICVAITEAKSLMAIRNKQTLIRRHAIREVDAE